MKFKQGSEYTIRRLIAILLIILIVFVLFKVLKTNTKNQSNSESNNNANISQIQNSVTDENTTSWQSKVAQEEDITFTLATTGDIMCHNTNFLDAYNSSTKSYDFSYYFTDIKQYLHLLHFVLKFFLGLFFT